MNTLEKTIDRYQTICKGGAVVGPTQRYAKYALSNFRGGIGKTTLAFNLAYELSRKHSLLLMDVCPQSSFSELILGPEALEEMETNIYDALLPRVSVGSSEPVYAELLHSVSMLCPSFKGGKQTYMVPGSEELYLFPSSLYNAINTIGGLEEKRKKPAINNILNCLNDIIAKINEVRSFEKTMIDTSPFFAGATHLAWSTVDALIIPVRVDQQSIAALDLTLRMLTDPDMDFRRINSQAGRMHIPRVHAIAMTHCGWNRQDKFTPDYSTQAFVSKVLALTEKYHKLFTFDDPTDSIFLMDDFHSAGRISGALRIPITRLEKGQFKTIDKNKRRLEVNESVDRYQREIRALASIL